MQFSYILAAATAFVSFVPSISATSDSENGRGIRHHRSHRRSYGNDDYGRDYDYDYGYGYGHEYDNDYGYGGEGKYYGNNRGHGRNNGGYYRYRRNEDSIKQADAAENIEQTKQSTVAEQADGHRHRRHYHHHERRSGNRYYGGSDYDYDYGYGGRHRRSNYYYY